MFGHRPDGKRLKNMDPIIRITPFLMPMRCDAQVFLEHKMDYEKAARYIAEKNRQGERITFMQIIAAASPANLLFSIIHLSSGFVV